MFTLKKVVGALLLPLPLLLILLVAGVVSVWKNGSSRSGRWSLTLATLLLLILSLSFVPYHLGRDLEGRFPAYVADDGREPAYVVVLGGGVGDDATRPASTRLSPASLARLVEGIRIVRLHPGSTLVVSGGRVFTKEAEGDAMAETARLLGVDPARIVVDSLSRDTEQQARIVKEIAGDRRFVLVTAAVHMPRSMALFRAQGMNPIPAPAGHRFDRSFLSGPRAWLPAAEHLRALESVLHEYYGFVWAWMRGRV